MKALAQFLLWRHRGESFEQTVEMTLPDGTSVRHRMKWRKTDQAAAESEVVRQLSSLTDLPDLKLLDDNES